MNNSKVTRNLYNHHLSENNDYSCIEGLSHTVYEFMNVKSLLSLEDIADLEKEDREHVTMYFRKNPNKFKIGALKPEECQLNSKKDKLLTVDSKEDYDRFMTLKDKIDLDSEIDFESLYNILDTLK